MDDLKQDMQRSKALLEDSEQNREELQIHIEETSVKIQQA